MTDDGWVDAGPLRIPRAELDLRATPAGGPGGQHVNRVATRVELWWDVRSSRTPSEAERALLLDRLASRLDSQGRLRIVAARSRSQHRNREDAVERLATLVAAALRPRKVRRRTKVPTAVKARRLEAKRHRGTLKSARSRVRDDE